MDQNILKTERPLLFSIAYRMLGSASDAEDVLQDAWVRYQSVDQSSIRSIKAFMTTVVTRLCLDRLKSARKTREEYIGPWLPEPVLTSEVESPESMLQRSESVTLAFLVLLEQLSPEERAVFLLKDIFEYEHSEIADILGTTTENSRQLLHRAKERVASGRPRLDGTSAARRAMAERFAKAFQSGDARELSALLGDQVGLWADGGGKVTAGKRPLVGRTEVQNLLLGIHRIAIRSGAGDRATLEVAEVNHEPAVVLKIDGRLDGVYVLSIRGGGISALRIVRNPDKLTYIGQQLSSRHEIGE